ncbi:MAG: TIGR03905 family TSCPD domain-containing protein [Clostridiales bacterium]|nr:TIGR03905 family TSCPD domain-containing protein [Clostridiales bacterium]
MKITYKPQGVCSRNIKIEIENDIIKNVTFIGGCDGNAKGISRLIQGMNKDDVIKKLSGITCGNRATSCPAQLAKALKENF